MFKCNFKAYEGKEKYIFISYAHKDSDMVYPIIEKLNEEGYRVWYDDGITPGSEWPEFIADHLARCETFVFFASPNSVTSENCKREVNFALSRNKKFFTISLVPTELSLGLEMQISTQQNIQFYEYTDIVKFYDTLFLASSIAGCKRLEGEIDEPAAETPVSTGSSNSFVREPAVGEPPKKKSKKGLIIGLIAAAVVIVAVLVVVLVGVLGVVGVSTGVFSSKVKLDDYHEYDKDETFLSLYNYTIDESVVKKLSKLKKLEYISISNCSFDYDTDLSSLQCLPNVTNLIVSDSDLTDFSFLSEMTSLETLTLSDVSFYEYDKLPKQNLKDVTLVNMTFVPVNEFSDCKNLRSLSMVDCNLKPDTLGTLPSSIHTLGMSGCGLSDTSFLYDSEFKELYSLDLSNNNISDVGFIEDSAATIYYLYLANNPLNDTSLSAIQNCVNIRTLNLSNIPMDDLSVITQMSYLSYLNLSNCGISKLDNGSLASKENLSTIILAHNNIDSLKALSEITVAEYGFDVLDISNNPISKFEGLPDNTHYEYFIAYDTEFSENSDNLQFLKDCTFGDLVINYYDGIETAQVTNNLVVVDCPTDKYDIVDRSAALSVNKLYTDVAADDKLKESMYEYVTW